MAKRFGWTNDVERGFWTSPSGRYCAGNRGDIWTLWKKRPRSLVFDRLDVDCSSLRDAVQSAREDFLRKHISHVTQVLPADKPLVMCWCCAVGYGAVNYKRYQQSGRNVTAVVDDNVHVYVLCSKCFELIPKGRFEYET